MSEAKDARWMLATKIAKAEGADLYAASYETKEAYLRIARESLEGRDPEYIARLAAEFRAEPNSE